jgi:hypothetical protein
MRTDNNFISGLGIAAVATTLALSPRARRVVRNGVASVVSRATTLGRIVARGTRNLQEESKHVTRFGVEAADGGPDASTVTRSPATDPPSS